jgi:hypothetical protein
MIPIARTMGAKAQEELRRLREQEQVNLQTKRHEQREDSLNYWNMQMKQRQMDQAARQSNQDYLLRMAEMQGRYAGATGQGMSPEMVRGMDPMSAMGYITGQMEGHQDHLARQEKDRLAAEKRQREVDWHNMRMMKGGQDYTESKELHPSRRALSEGQAAMMPVLKRVQQLNREIQQAQSTLRGLNPYTKEAQYNAVEANIRSLQEQRSNLTNQLQAAGAVFGGAPSAGPMGAGGDPDSPW